ncbi:hypothetical protein CYY_006793 [Polysphondylium violaceum]|uniref:fructokinase n=1 Tax=Polysphondylium violaceum TaxID=133409 RepID=A0A8J4PYZ6_9MYCE|nr:hypothetical protein CYY_006793 [Polysphondylium violaceum]
MQNNLLFAGIEAGGTGFSLAIASGQPSNIIEKTHINTTTPEETRENVLNWLRGKEFNAIGLASFGPVDLDKDSATYGYITTTPKPKWGNTDILGWFKEFDVPKGFDTDVNGAAISETFHGLHKRGPITSCAYITVGTGVGVGVVVNETPIHGLVHPEGGHTFARILPNDKSEGTCPFHKNCIEGLVSTGAISKRLNLTNDQLKNVGDEDPVWTTIGHYLAQLCANITLLISPQVIVLGGGVFNRKILYDIVRKETINILNGYIKSKYLTIEYIDQYIVQSPFDNNAGLVGSLELARRAILNQSN